MIPQLERRLGKLEAKLKPRALRAIIDAFLDWSALADSGYVSRPLPPDDSRLHQGVDEHGDAVISRWWSVSFFEGTRELCVTKAVPVVKTVTGESRKKGAIKNSRQPKRLKDRSSFNPLDDACSCSMMISEEAQCVNQIKVLFCQAGRADAGTQR